MPEPRTLDYGPHALRLSSGVLWATRQAEIPTRRTVTKIGRKKRGTQQKGR